MPTLSEAQLENKWIQPILAKLGWEYEVQDRLKKWGKTEIPDYSLFESKKTYLKGQGCKTDDAYFEHVLAVADAKQMGVSLDGSKLDKSNPSYQIIWYQQITGKNWGILTDGKYWRLYSLRSKSKFTSYYEINIEKLIVEKDDEQFKYFYNFFRREAFSKLPDSNQCFLDVVFDKGERYAREVETRLKDRAFQLVEQICNGFLTDFEGTPSEQELSDVYDNSLQYLFRLMFILNCEAKGLLNVDKQSDYYVHSLRNLCFQIKNESESNMSWSNMPRSFNHISLLFSLLEKGDATIGIHGFGEEVFAIGKTKFFKNHPIPDAFLNSVLLELAFAQDNKEKDLRLIDYKRLSADHLGSLFEGLLEFRLQSDKKNKYVLVNSNGERKSTGSFYTPEPIVDYIVQQALEPIVENLSPKQILDLKILDPAMGSGHFLLGVLKFLEGKLIQRIAETTKGSNIDPYEIRWQVLHSCIFGVDINSLAVDLAKFSLWIYSARSNQLLEPLGDQLKFGDSLIDDKKIAGVNAFNWKRDFQNVDSFSAIVGNPPYVFTRDNFSEEKKNYFQEEYKVRYYKANLYQFFIEKSVRLLNGKGTLGFIVPNNWLTLETYEDLRRYILEQEGTISILNASEKIFKDASVDTCILLMNPVGENEVRYSTFTVGKFDKPKICKKSDLLKNSGCVINPVVEKGSSITKLISKIEKAGLLLESVADVKNGVQAYTVGEGTPTQTLEMKEKRVYHSKTKKGSEWVKYVDGIDVKLFHLGWSGQYIKYGKYLSRPREKELFEGPRILVRQIPAKPPRCILASYTDEDLVNDNNSMIVKSTNAQYSTEILLSLLNSKLITFWFVHKTGKLQRKVFPQFKVKELRAFPIFDAKANVAALKKIELCTLKILKSGKIKDDDLHQIDEAIYELFDLTKSEIELIETNLAGFTPAAA